MSIGMTYDEFWNQDVALVKVYRKADELTRRRQNEIIWMQGAYICEALSATVGNMFSGKGSKKHEYPKEPYPITAEQIAEREERRQRNMEERLKAEFAAFAASVGQRISHNE